MIKVFDDLIDTIKDLTSIINKTVEFSIPEVTESFLVDSNYYIPKVVGDLEKSSIIWSVTEEGHIEWRTPYARRLFYNPQYNFSHDANPNACGLWAEKAKNENIDKYKILTNEQFEKAKDLK